MARYIAAIDQGTTSTRCILFDENRASGFSTARASADLSAPRVGSNTTPWKSGRTREVIQQGAAIVKAPGSRRRTLRGSRRDRHRPTSAKPPSSGTAAPAGPCSNAIVWQDTRTKAICDRLGGGRRIAHRRGRRGGRGGGIDRFRAQSSGCPWHPISPARKLRWLLETSRSAADAARQGEAVFGAIDTWLTWWLTGGPGWRRSCHRPHQRLAHHVHGPPGSWIGTTAMLTAIGVPRSMLPEYWPAQKTQPVRGSYGRTAPAAPFGRAPVCGSSAISTPPSSGQSCFAPGESKTLMAPGASCC